MFHIVICFLRFFLVPISTMTSIQDKGSGGYVCVCIIFKGICTTLSAFEPGVLRSK